VNRKQSKDIKNFNEKKKLSFPQMCRKLKYEKKKKKKTKKRLANDSMTKSERVKRKEKSSS
jgi:hypothetical protein